MSAAFVADEPIESNFCGCVARVGAGGSKWGLKILYYHLVMPCMDRATQLKEMRSVFDHISSVIDLTFVYTDDPMKANLLYLAGRGSRANLDGPMGTLAYAYLPNTDNYKGQLNCVFDLDEKWNSTIKFFNVMYHETLHLLGFDHSMQQGQLLSPIYSSAIDLPQNEDTSRMVRKYGRAIPKPVQPDPTPWAHSDLGSVIIDINGQKFKTSAKWIQI